MKETHPDLPKKSATITSDKVNVLRRIHRGLPKKDTFNLNVRAAFIMSFRSKFATIPKWLWLSHILLTSFFSMLMFALIASYVGNPEVTVQYVVIGNAVQTVAVTTMKSIADIPNVEKHMGTLPPLMVAPSNLFEVFLGMSLLNIFAGFISASSGLVYAAFIFGVDFSMANVPLLALAIVMTSASLTGLGMAIGGMGLHLRTSVILANVTSYVSVVLCGVNFPVSYLPEWAQYLSAIHPLTYAVEATRCAVCGCSLAEIMGPISMMAILGLVFLLFSMVFFKHYETKSKVSGTLEAF